MKARRIFVYLQDTSAKAMKDYYDFVSSTPFPEGTEKGVRKAGTSSDMCSTVAPVSDSTRSCDTAATRLLSSTTWRFRLLS